MQVSVMLEGGNLHTPMDHIRSCFPAFLQTKIYLPDELLLPYTGNLHAFVDPLRDVHSSLYKNVRASASARARPRARVRELKQGCLH